MVDVPIASHRAALTACAGLGALRGQGGRCAPSVSAPAPTVGDTAELLDIEMDQLPGTGLLIAHRHRAAHRQPGGLIHLAQAGHVVPGQDAPHSGARQAQVVGDAVGSPPAVEPQGDDAPLSAPCQPPWAVVGTPGAVLHGLAGPVPDHPPADGRRRDLEAFSHPAHGPAFFHHQTSKTTTPLRDQRCVSVGHEGLQSAMRVCQPTSCRRPSHNLTPVHNLPRKYN